MALNDYLAMMKDFRKLSLNGLQRKVEAGGLQDNPRIKDCLRDCWGQRRCLTDRSTKSVWRPTIQKDGLHEHSMLSAVSTTSFNVDSVTECPSKPGSITQRHLAAKVLVESFGQKQRIRNEIRNLDDTEVASRDCHDFPRPIPTRARCQTPRRYHPPTPHHPRQVVPPAD
jgi:hypothetical protein